MCASRRNLTRVTVQINRAKYKSRFERAQPVAIQRNSGAHLVLVYIALGRKSVIVAWLRVCNRFDLYNVEL